MFKDLKEYQDITRIYNESVNISEEQRAINKLFQEEDFTLEELDYLEENLDTIWEEYFEPEIIDELCEDVEHVRSLTEEDINEVLFLKTLAKGAIKASRGLRKANIGIVKGLRSAKTAAKDTFKGAKGFAGDTMKKIAPLAGKVAKTIGKGALLGTGALIPFSIANSLRKRGKEERLKNQGPKVMPVAGDAATKGGSKVGDAASKVPDITKIKNDAGKAGSEAAKNVTRNINIYLGSSAKKGGDVGSSVMSKAQANKRAFDNAKDDKPKMSSIEKKNRARLGDAKVDSLKAKQVDFKKMRKGEMSKADFIKAYPNSITAQRAKGLRDHTEWDAYDMVLEYLFSTEQVSSLEEANYVMMEMDQETIGSIVSEVKYVLDEGFVDNLKAGFKKVGKVAGDVVQKGKDAVSGVKDKVVKRVERRKENVAINKKIEDKKSNMNDDNAGRTKAQIMALNRKKEKLNNPKEYERKQNMSGADRAKELFKQRMANKK